MTIQIIGSVDKDRLYCAGSVTKFLTAFVCLSLLSEKYNLRKIVDDDNFLNTICITPKANEFLKLFQRIIGSQFSIRDICSHYSGLPYTFDVSENELTSVELHHPFKHHCIPDEETFLYLCKNNITPVYPNRCKFHYSELSMIFLGYLIENTYNVKMKDLYQTYLIDKCKLKNSIFSIKRVENVYCQDLSDKYDYAAIAILDHGYFCYSNGYYTTLNDMKILIEYMLENSVFKYMIDVTHARAASHRLMNGLSIEIRLADNDILVGYEGLSFSGCNLWAYSTKNKQGYISFSNNEETIYDVVYGQLGYSTFDRVPTYTEVDYDMFIKSYHSDIQEISVPEEYQGHYHRVKINEKELKNIFVVSNHYIMIRNPEEIQYNIIYLHGNYRILNKDHVHGAKVGFYSTKSENKYMFFDGTLYQKILE